MRLRQPYFGLESEDTPMGLNCEGPDVAYSH